MQPVQINIRFLPTFTRWRFGYLRIFAVGLYLPRKSTRRVASIDDFPQRAHDDAIDRKSKFQSSRVKPFFDAVRDNGEPGLTTKSKIQMTKTCFWILRVALGLAFEFRRLDLRTTHPV